MNTQIICAPPWIPCVCLNNSEGFLYKPIREGAGLNCSSWAPPADWAQHGLWAQLCPVERAGTKLKTHSYPFIFSFFFFFFPVCRICFISSAFISTQYKTTNRNPLLYTEYSAARFLFHGCGTFWSFILYIHLYLYNHISVIQSFQRFSAWGSFPRRFFPLTSYVFIWVIPEAVVDQNKSPPVIPVPYTPKSEGKKKMYVIREYTAKTCGN